MNKNILFALLLFFSLLGCKTTINKYEENSKGKLTRMRDKKTGYYAYYDQNNKKVLGDYFIAYSETITDFGIVNDGGAVLIDRSGKHICKIFWYDNGPDYTVEGYYRIVGGNGKIGYVDSLSSKLMIEPKFDCAFPFENGRAKVSTNCMSIKEGEHSRWESNDWYFIDKLGNVVE